MPGLLTRRQTMQLSTLVVAGWAASAVLRRTVPIGRDIGRAGAVATILNGERFPMSGPPDASLHLAVFSDYRCPACRRAFPALEEAIRKDADIRVIYKDWPIFGPPSERAARVALASGEQGIYPAVHRRLMTDSRGIDDGMLSDVITDAGGDWTRTIAYLTSHDEQISALLPPTVNRLSRSDFLARRATLLGRCWSSARLTKRILLGCSLARALHDAERSHPPLSNDIALALATRSLPTRAVMDRSCAALPLLRNTITVQPE